MSRAIDGWPELSCPICRTEQRAIGIDDAAVDRALAEGPTCCQPLPDPDPIFAPMSRLDRLVLTLWALVVLAVVGGVAWALVAS